MLAHEGEKIEIDFSAYRALLRQDLDSDKAVNNYIETHSFEQPYSLDDLGLSSKEELLEAYFNFDSQTSRGVFGGRQDKRPRVAFMDETRFMALLIKLGFHVWREDLGPILHIDQVPDPQ